MKGNEVTLADLTREKKELPKLPGLEPSEGVTLLVGSAISMWEPTLIPVGNDLTQQVASMLADRYPIEADRKWLAEAIAKTPFEYLCDECPRREVVREAVIEIMHDRRPNEAHQAVARLVHQGTFRHVITTNYDTCFETLLPNELPLKHIVIREDWERIGVDQRVLFKIHGAATPECSNSLVFHLSQEGQLDLWKREVLRHCIEGQQLVVIGYSGRDFEICPELPGAGPKRLVWNVRQRPEEEEAIALSPNAEWVVREAKGVVVQGDLRGVLGALGESCGEMDEGLKPNGELRVHLERALSPKELERWACAVLVPPGYGRQGEILARRLLDMAGDDALERATASMYLADARFVQGKYDQAAELGKEAGSVFANAGQIDDYFHCEFKAIDALRSGGRLREARRRLKAFEIKLREELTDASRLNVLQSRLNLLHIVLHREDYLRFLAMGLKRCAQSSRAQARQRLRDAVAVAAPKGYWRDLQTCAIEAGRLGIPFKEVNPTSLHPTSHWFWTGHLGDVVGEMMAARDSLWGPAPLVNEEGLRNLIEMARKIGCNPEVWKLTVELHTRFGKQPGESVMDWLCPFLQCEYTLITRLMRLRWGFTHVLEPQGSSWPEFPARRS